MKFVVRIGDLIKLVYYGELCEKVENEFLKESYDFIEIVVLNLVDFILNEYKIINRVKVFFKKLWVFVKKYLDIVEIMIERKRYKVYIGLGLNIGDKEKNLNDLIDKILE